MIAIRVVSRAGVALERLSLGATTVAQFGDAVGDIGRGADCTLVLPDPDRQISRRQALIICRGDRHYICSVGANLAVELNGQILEPEVEAELKVGTEFRIGSYLLRVEAPALRLQPEPRPTPIAPLPPAPTPAPAPAKVREEPEASTPAESSEDPLALFGQPKAVGGSVFRDLLDNPTSTGMRASPQTASVSERPPGRRKKTAAAAPARAGISGVERDERRPADIAKERGDRPARAGRRQAGQVDEIEALFAGLGVRVPEDPALRGKQVRLLGEMLRALIGGTLELLAARTVAKRELGDNATLLQARENNPLKFSPDTDAALARMLAPPARGFIDPLAAVHDAFTDLRSHQVAMLTGMRAALDEVLARFDPEALEPRLVPGALWDKLVPANRKAKLWEQYCEQYAQILREVEGDFDTMFGRAFLRAYRAQLAEFQRSRRVDTADGN